MPCSPGSRKDGGRSVPRKIAPSRGWFSLDPGAHFFFEGYKRSVCGLVRFDSIVREAAETDEHCPLCRRKVRENLYGSERATAEL